MKNNTSLRDKIHMLKSKKDLLVKSQMDELDRLTNFYKVPTNVVSFVESLYEHYIVKGLPKTYMCS